MSDLVLARRSFLKGLGAAALVAAPAIVMIENLMPIKRMIVPWQHVIVGWDLEGGLVKTGKVAPYVFSAWFRVPNGPLRRPEDITPLLTFQGSSDGRFVLEALETFELADAQFNRNQLTFNSIDGQG